MKHKFRVFLLAVAGLILVLGPAFYFAFPWYRHFLNSVTDEWNRAIFVENIPKPDNLRFGDDGILYVSSELGHKQAKILAITPDKQHSVVVDSLSRADGLRWHKGALYITEEKRHGRILRFDLKTKQLAVLGTANHSEGVDVLPNGDVVVSEDIKGGRLLIIGRDGIQTIAMNLRRPEGICVDTEGNIYVAETSAGKILKFVDGRKEVFLRRLYKPDQISMASDGALWITEDSRSGSLFRYYRGKLETVATGLHSPSGIAFDSENNVFVAEQARNRILIFSRRHN